MMSSIDKFYVIIMMVMSLSNCKTSKPQQVHVPTEPLNRIGSQFPKTTVDDDTDSILESGVFSKENFSLYETGTKFLYQDSANYPATAAKKYDSLGFSLSTEEVGEAVEIREGSSNWIQVLNQSENQWLDAVKVEQFDSINQSTENNFDWKGFFAKIAYCSLSQLKFELTNCEPDASFSLSGRILCEKMTNGDCVYNYGTCKGRKYIMRLSKNNCESGMKHLEAIEGEQHVIHSKWFLKCKKK